MTPHGSHRPPFDHKTYCAGFHGDDVPCIRYVERTLIFDHTVHSSPSSVAAGLREIADRIEAEELTLIGMWSTGFGGPAEACLQVVATYEEEVPDGTA